ncbi:MAG: helicase [Alicyclobacillus macrosporangiidus]|uniref:helicase-related protein n=1 Tax=Alicyclobacillus macrosporangiidus TaxID=392015 RepID=UPI0026EA2C76|nr:helicase-related protein [Alicyclobacillus macrosporangiidus]MCL6597622.1 helicase [Alicyclobacillus macrosporangiidus]
MNGRTVDILHDFYIPALQLATRYDRVAGYFRSTSLAAASQGFSSFVSRGGRMRMIVGADLDPADVRAILDGDAKRLEQRLAEELAAPETWPEDVRNGVTLLAWMVAQDVLQVRVAFRRHRETGEPIALDSTEDGYVHEKWFVLYDDAGHRMYGCGTLNESKTALQLNAESFDLHCDWWGERERWRCDDAEQTFEALWEGKVPHMPVYTLPEAVKKQLIHLAEGRRVFSEIDGTSVSVAPAKLSAREHLRFAIVRDAPKLPGGQYVGIETAPVEPWPHQLVVARRLVDHWPYTYMLCDEVGLGKTIEAGLAFRSLYLSGLAHRILVAAPAGLTVQWLRQMASKVLLPFARLQTSPSAVHQRILPQERDEPARGLYDPDLLIVSTGLWLRDGPATDLTGVEAFDIVLIDEAHMVRRRNSSGGMDEPPDYGNLYKFVRNQLKSKARSLWLATATPLQLDMVEVCDLIALTGRVSGFQYEPRLVDRFYKTVDKLSSRQELTAVEWAFLRRAVESLKVHDEVLWKFYEAYFLNGSMQSALDRWLSWDEPPRQRDREHLLRMILLAAPLSRVMMRHTRSLLEEYRKRGQLTANLAHRVVCPVEAIRFDDVEKQVYDLLNAYCQGLRDRLGQSQRTVVRFLESLLRLRFASSMYAFERTVERRLERVKLTLDFVHSKAAPEAAETITLDESVFDTEEEGDEAATEGLLSHRRPDVLEWEAGQLQEMLRVMRRVQTTSSKLQRLLEVLNDRRDRTTKRIQQTVIFTRFYDTLEHIVETLLERTPGIRLATYSGRGASYYDPERVESEREEVKERFLRGEIDVLVCTDAAAEGLNLQTADLLINFDLGWNPMKIEQRIGRIDRIGQRHSVIYVMNLCYAGSEEDVVYKRLLERLQQANVVVGPQQLSLLPVRPEEFQKLAEGAISAEELERNIAQRIKEEEQRAETMQISAKDLFDVYQRMLQSDSDQTSPIRLEHIWRALVESEYLAGLGCHVETTPQGEVFVVHGVPGVPDGTRLTVSRTLYEEGLPGGGRVHFASYGDPYFDAILAHVLEQELPACIRRVEASVDGAPVGGASVGVESHAPLVGYVVACRTQDGTPVTRYVQSWTDVDGLGDIDVSRSITDEEVTSLHRDLTRQVLNRAEKIRSSERVQAWNEQVARFHEWLTWLTAHRLLFELNGHQPAEQVTANTALRQFEQRFANCDSIRIPHVPVQVLNKYARDALIPILPDTYASSGLCSIPVAQPMVLCALSCAQRQARALKSGRGAVMLDRLLRQLEEGANRKQANL